MEQEGAQRIPMWLNRRHKGRCRLPISIAFGGGIAPHIGEFEETIAFNIGHHLVYNTINKVKCCLYGVLTYAFYSSIFYQ